MGLFLTKHMPEASLGVWEITEALDVLYDMARLSGKERSHYASLHSPLRKKHWLSYRLILPSLLPGETPTGISYDPFGKPRLDNGRSNLSVAHSGVYAALMVSPTRAVGIDIEAIQPKIHRLAHKFLREEELDYHFTSHATESLMLIWCAKEALYKLHGRREISFKEHILVKPFAFTATGRINASIEHREINKHYALYYDMIGEYLLVYVIDN